MRRVGDALAVSTSEAVRPQIQHFATSVADRTLKPFAVAAVVAQRADNGNVLLYFAPFFVV